MNISDLLQNLTQLPSYVEQLKRTINAKIQADKVTEKIKSVQQPQKAITPSISPDLGTNIQNLIKPIQQTPQPNPYISNETTKQGVVPQGAVPKVSDVFTNRNIEEDLAAGVLGGILSIYTKYKTERNMGVKPLEAISNAANSLVGDREKTAYTNAFLEEYNKQIKEGKNREIAINKAQTKGRFAQQEEQIRPFANFILSSGNIKQTLGPEDWNNFDKYMTKKYGESYQENVSLVNIKKEFSSWIKEYHISKFGTESPFYKETKTPELLKLGTGQEPIITPETQGVSSKLPLQQVVGQPQPTIGLQTQPIKPVGKEIIPLTPQTQSLAEEAKKYKSAEEFIDKLGMIDINNRFIFHGTGKKSAQSIIKNGFDSSSINERVSGISFTNDPKFAEFFAKERKGYTEPAVVVVDTKGLKIAKLSDFEKRFVIKSPDDFIRLAKKEGFDGVDYDSSRLGFIESQEGEITIFNPKSIKPLPIDNLTDFYNQVTQKANSEKKPGELPKEPIKYSNLDYAKTILNQGKNLLKQQKSSQSLLSSALTQLYDKYYPINEFIGKAEKLLGRHLTAEENAYIGARLYAGVGGKITAKLNDLSDILKSDIQSLKNNNLSVYLFNQRAIERSDRGITNPGNITKDIATKAIEEMKSNLGPEKFAKLEQTAAKIYQYGDKLLQYIRDNGIISREAYNAIKSKNQMYVPFDVIEHMIDNESIIPSNSKAFSVASQSLVKSMKGTTKEIDDPINALTRKTMRVVDLVERNNVSKQLYNLKNILGKDANSFIKDYTDGQAIPKNWGKLNVFENGIKKSFLVPSTIAESMNRMTEKQVDMITRTASLGAKALRSGATSLNIAFIIPNALRDFETATLVSKVGFNIKDWTKGFWEALKATGKELGLPVNDSMYQKYLQEAGEIGGYYSTYLREVPKTVKELTKPAWEKVLSLLNPLKLIETAGEAVERTPRLGIFMKALSKGMSGKEAAFLSREATIDFAKMGESMRIFNMWVPFVNARLQGEINIAKSLYESKNSASRMAELFVKIMGLAILPFVASYYNNTKRFPDVWDDLADYEKANYIILILGDKKDNTGRYTQVIKFPKGDWNYFIDPIQDILEWNRNKNTSLFNDLANDSLMDLIPISTAPQSSIGGTVEQLFGGILPPPIKAGVETITNKNLYTMRDIVPQSLEFASPKQQYKSYTPYIAKQLGDWLNISPLKVDNAISTGFGGLGGQVLGLGGTVEKPGITLPLGNVQRRFTGAQGGQTEKTEQESLKKYITEMYDRKAVETRTAENLWSKIKDSTPQEVTQIIQDIGDNDSIKEKLKNIIEKETQGKTYTDQEISMLSPKERAKYILDTLYAFKTPEEATNFMANLKNKGLITEETKKEIMNYAKTK